MGRDIAPGDRQVQLLKRMALALSAVLILAPVSALHAQATSSTTVHDSSALHPPAGARVAIVEFEDMECPRCGQVNPILKQAAEKYHIPWVRHDFPLSMHVWSFDAAVDARWFDTHSKQLGDEFRDAVFATQASLETKQDLRAFAEKFGQLHGVGFPFAVDPQGKLAAAVKADYALGERIGIEHTPTIWIVTSLPASPYREVVDVNNLYQMIDQAQADTAHQAPPAKAAHHVVRRK